LTIFTHHIEMDYISDFNALIKEKLGFSMFPYQESVSKDIINTIDLGEKFIVASMPTGSGKTVIEIFLAYYLMKKGFKRIIVMEPTRLLCDQMFTKFWKKVYQDIGMEYEGNCEAFNEGKSIIVSTPFTAAKCGAKADAIIFDEVHHAFGDSRYTESLMELNPKLIIGLTALLPGYKRYKLDLRVSESFGEPIVLSYDFKALSKIDPSFKPPKAIADLFDAEMDSLEDNVYELFFKRKAKGNKETLKFLEVTLYSYGKSAFCESLERLRDKVQDNTAYFMLCDSKGLSHKARALQDILSVYKVEYFKPVLIFTSRKATAYEFEKAIRDEVDMRRVKVLTGDASKEERQKLVDSAKRGDVDVIISTLVGEEGIDIPEAKLLIMTDVPQSPLRFYQRLGRLIRSEKEETQKFLVVALTPKTPEYDNLDDALRNLFAEGVDVSYIIEKKEGKGPVAKVIDIINKEKEDVIPFLKLTQETDLKPSIYIKEQGKNTNSVYYEILSSNVKINSEEGFSPYLDKAIKEGSVLYSYDVEEMGELLSKVLLGKYCTLCYGELCTKVCNTELNKIGLIKSIKLDKKNVLRLYMKIFLKENSEKVKECMKKQMEDSLQNLKEKDINVIINETYNKSFTSITETINFNVSIDRMTIYPKVQITYYDINKENRDIAKMNAMAIGYKAIELFFKELEKATNLIKESTR
jgi:superfamily II DNA or RNA helicase